MRRFLAIAALAALPFAGHAQEEDGGTRLERLLEGALSEEGNRDVRITGFRGLLSSEATLERMTISDAEGVWLTLENASLDWTQSALLRGALVIEELSAERLVLDRLPVAETDAPAPEATPIALPDLPVSVSIGATRIARIELGAAVLGEALALSAEAALELSGGAGSTQLSVTRLDGPTGRIVLDASYDNGTGILSLDLDAEEDAGGIVAGLLSVPDEPALALTAEGTGPLTDFAAEFALATDGVDRLSGGVTLLEGEDAVRRFDLDIRGDLRPLVSSELDPFFGSETELFAEAARMPDGALTLDTLRVSSAALNLRGTAALLPGGAPARFSLQGGIVPPDGAESIRIPGDTAEIGRAEIDLQYDQATGDRIAGEVEITRLSAEGFSAGTATVLLDGRIDQGEGGTFAGVAAEIALAARGISAEDPAIAAAIGPTLALETGFGWRADSGTLTLEGIEGRIAAGSLAGGVTVRPEGTERLDVTADLSVDLSDISPLSLLAGQGISGGAAARLQLSADALSGAFDLRISGRTRDIAAEALPEGLLAGETSLVGRVARDETGITFDGVRIAGTAVGASADGRLASGETDLEFDLRLSDAAIVTPDLSGPVRATGRILRSSPEAPYRMPDLRIESALGVVAGDFSALPADERLDLSGTVAATIPDLAPLSSLARNSLSGSAALTANFTAEARAGDFDVGFAGETRDIRFGEALPPQLLAGRTEVSGRVARDGGDVVFEAISLDGSQLALDAEGRIGPDRTGVDFTASLADASILTSALPGRIGLSGSIARAEASDPFTVAADLDGPGGMTLQAGGTADAALSDLDIDLSGRLPLALANRFIAPRAVDGTLDLALAIRGRPGLAGLSGRLSATGARLTAPTFAVALEDISATIDLDGANAGLSASGRLSTGGQVTADGTIGIGSPALPARIEVAADAARIVDPTLFEARIDEARLLLEGPLAGGASLTGTIRMGETEIRVPESGVGTSEAIPDIRHTGDGGAVRTTRSFAGLDRRATGGGGGGRGAIGLGIDIEAPGRIFLRGRGLDAELGGRVRITGDTANIVPAGQFELVRGRLSIFGRRIDLTEGAVTLRGGDPYIDLTAQSDTPGYTVFVEIEGFASAPDVSFRSEPPLPEDEVLAQLFFGRSATSLSPVQLLQLADAAASLAGGSSSGLFTRLREGLGLDNLDIQSDEEGNAAVRAGRYLSDNIYTDLIIDSEGTGVTLNIDLTPDITARGGVTSTGESSVGVFFERDY